MDEYDQPCHSPRGRPIQRAQMCPLPIYTIVPSEGQERASWVPPPDRMSEIYFSPGPTQLSRPSTQTCPPPPSGIPSPTEPPLAAPHPSPQGPGQGRPLPVAAPPPNPDGWTAPRVPVNWRVQACSTGPLPPLGIRVCLGSEGSYARGELRVGPRG
jgi:hypothetical protein